ncbi:protein dopey-1 homolog isoform X1 [Eupeodes corollae]|uniref:protein dopey-1 homolog isoform X1 n=1 Tax=Eupeodes corollae TaxID=290404 RepID=UPI0024930400|nr:protein dopey-1 homolog isoform X1 [Eupeodes corollae]
MESADALEEEKKLLNEAKYRNYMSNIDKALRNFEYSSEWADLISALGKLNKAISSNTQYQIIPRRIKISKRLAQCMHPALPSGVHLKALETYDVIFSKTGPERLATELFIYSAGLFPLLGYAAMNVRPALLGVYEKYFVPLGDKLRPALSGFLSGVLPGYENGLDHYDRTNTLLTQVCVAVNPKYFYTVMWECVATNASIRLPAISYLLDHFNKRLGMQQQVYIMGHNRDVMMSGLCACLNDSLILVQRNTLEFLLLGFPMHTHYLSEADLVKLVTNGLNTILRRDMSLNRRLYSWLLGAEVAKSSSSKLEQSLDDTTDESTESNFDKHSKHILIQSIICTLKFSLESTPVDLKPYRIMVSLLDKAEIGSAVLDYVLCDIIRTMSLSSGNVEVVKSANLLFATFDPAYIWSFMTIIYEKSCKKRNESSHLTRNLRHSSSASKGGEKFQCQVGSGEPSLVEICYLTEFLLETISLEMYNETTRIYLPKVFLAITQMLTIHSEYLSSDDIIASLKLCMKIVSRVQPMITSPVKLYAKSQVTGQDDQSMGGESVQSANAVSGSSTALPGSTLEKSKSDSKLNQSAAAFDVDANKDSLSSSDEPIRRSNSNQNIDRRPNTSPKKTKKAKSFSKLSELDKEICPDTGQLINPQSSSDQDTPLSIKKLKNKKISPQLRLKMKKSRPQDLPVSDRDVSDSVLLSALESKDAVQQETKKVQKPPKETQFMCDTQECTSDEFSILEKCIRQYEVFFEVYLARKVLQINVQRTACTVTVKVETDPESNAPPNVENIFKNEEVYEDVCVERMLEIDRYFETLQVNMMCRSKQLHQLLSRSLISTLDSASDVSDAEFKDCLSSGEHLDKLQMFDEKTERNINKLMELRLSDSLRNAIRLAANLLVEMSTFPNCNKNLVLDKTENELPSWLKVLTLVASYTQSDKELQLAAITTLFDLISLLKSQIEHTTSPGVTFVVMLPLLKFGHVSYIENKTRIFQLITSVLWNYLGESTIDPMQITSLLYQLHNCLESGIVETVIGNRMSSHYDAQLLKLRTGDMKALSNYKTDRASEIKMMCVSPVQPIEHTDHLKESESQSFKKFELLWHLGRDKQPSKGFEKTLLRVLDTLGLPYYMPIRTFVTKWLQESLLRGDLSRLLKPLHKILLSSNTRRIGIVHFHLMKKDGEEAMAADAKEAEDKCDSVTDRGVFAISSEDGNVKYHIDSSLTKKRSPIRSFQKKIFGVTLGSKNKTSIFVSDKTTSSITESDTNIGLTINPLENEMDSVGSEEIPSLSSSAPNKMETSRKSSGNSDKEEKTVDIEDEDDDGPGMFDSSSTDDSECSTFETESENRENSVEKDIPTGGVGCGSLGNIKRYVGDCERVSEKLTEHDRTKNRKTYKLTRAGSEVMEKLENAMSSVVVDGHAVEGGDAVHVADEYFGSSADIVETFVGDLMDAVSKTCDQPKSTSSPRKKLKRVDAMRDQKSIKKSVSVGSGKDKKRMSCISKTSTDSNNSLLGGRSSNEEKGTVSESDGGSDEDVFVEEEPSSRSEKQSIGSGATINVEDKRRSLSLETGGTGHKIEWDLAKETLEKSKHNLEILRQNVALEAGKKHGHKKKNSKDFKRNFDKIHPFHTHMLLYFGVYDTKQTLYAFQTLRNIIACDTRTFLCLSITTSFSSGSMKQLLIRHRKTILGKGFAGSITNTEFSQSYRGCMHLEVLVTICLYYARGFFHKESTEGNDIPRKEDIVGNYKVQLQSVELLTLICSELIDIVKGMGKGLACYIADLMARCKLQKIILHCINSSVISFNQIRDHTLSEEILNFNNAGDEHLHAESFQIQLLRLLMAVIKLEYEVTLLQNESGSVEVGKGDTVSSNSPTRLSADGPVTNVKYLPNCLISQQHMFLSAVLSALQADHLRHVHRNWTDLVTSSLNCFTFGSLTNIVISVVHQLCNNLDKIAKFSLKQQCNFPPDYVVSQLEAITILCHYCLLDNTQQTTLSHLFNQAYPQTSAAVQSSNTGQLLNNIVHSFLSSQNSTDAQSRTAQHMAARNAVLSHLSRIVTSVAAIWDSELGQVRQVKQQLMEFLSPVSLHHGANFLAAVAVTWQERGEAHRKRTAAERNEVKLSIAEQFLRNSTPQACPEQLSLVKLVSSIRVMPMDSFVQTLHQVVKSPPPIHRPPAGLTIEVSALELFYFYMKSAPAPQLGDSWSSLLVLLRDGLNLSPPAQFTLLMLLSEFVQRCPQMPFQDKKDIRDVHDITSRLIEALTTVAGACLEPTTWLRRNLAVKEDTSPVTPDGTLKDLTGTQQYCIQAHSVLAATLANLLDVAYGSQEKDKVVTIVTNLMYTIMPYLKNHTARNIPSFYASSSLLASLSGYQYTRKAWRKDMLDLLLDNSFFQMDISCLPFWKQIMDSLMTYDSTTFRELMSRVSPAQGGSLYIFASREQEYEQRAMFLKRLAFVIFCSELDQYHKYMPEIQEQLANSLRLLPVIPAVQSAVFLCFRVLLLRMSPDHVTSLWPTIIAEMVQVFLAIEQELKSTTDDLRLNASNNNNSNNSNSQQMSWTANSSNGIASQNHLYHWRAVQLETAKLLELGCVLPATNLPHFQMYRWAFVGTEFNASENSISNGDFDDMLPNSTQYVPHIRRIARLMDQKYSVHSPKPDCKRGTHLVLTCQQIVSLQDLYGFFSTLSVTCPTPRNFADTGKEVSSCLAEIEEILAKDFLEKMPTSTTPR